MERVEFGKPSLKEILIILALAIICTFLMNYMNAYERLYLFTRMYSPFDFDDFVVFFPSFLAMGFILLAYRKIVELEFEIMKRKQTETKLLESEKKYKNLSITDDLTQLFNSRYFYAKLQEEIDRANRYNRPVSLLLIDIDDFKLYNDNYGHLKGDNVLAAAGDVIRKCLRKIDTAFRYGGEEFMVILPETPVEAARIVAERIRKAFEAETFRPEPTKEVTVTVSIGASQFEEGRKQFIQRADQAMYKAKAGGKNRVF